MSDETSANPPQNSDFPAENKADVQPLAPVKRADVAIISRAHFQERLAERLQPMLRSGKLTDLKMFIGQAVVETSTTFNGPIPPPQHFKEYEVILPGSADRILAMAEKEQSHRHSWEKSHLNWDGLCNVVGLTLGWLLSLCLAGGAIYCASIGQPWVAGALTGFAAFGGVASLIQGKRLFGKADHNAATKLPVPTKPNLPSGKTSGSKKTRRN